MWIEYKGEDGVAGPARIGRVTYSKSGKSLYYKGARFQSLSGRGFKSNYYKVGTREHYWFSGCRKDGKDALYNTDVTIDEDAREEYWTRIRGRPEMAHLSSFRARGKY